MKNKITTISVILLLISAVILLYRFDVIFPDEYNFKLRLTIHGDNSDDKPYWYFFGNNTKGTLKPVCFNKGRENSQQTSFFRLKNGKVTIMGYLKRPGVYILTNTNRSAFFTCMLDKGKQQIEVLDKDIKQAKGYLEPAPFKFSGSILNKEFIQFWEQKEAQQLLEASKEFRINQVHTSVLSSDTSGQPVAFNNTDSAYVKREQQLLHLKNLQQNLALNYLINNPNSYLALDYFLAYVYIPNYSTLDESTLRAYIATFGDTLRNTSVFESIEKKYITTQNFRVGKIPPAIELPNPKNNTVKLSDFTGSITLVNFWLMNCDYCKAEQTNLAELYAKYQNEQFKIFSISFDTDKESWKKYIKENGMPWEQVIDTTGFFNSQIIKSYGVGGIPNIFLLDKQGKVIANNLRSPDYAGVTKYNINMQLKKIFGF